MPDNTLQDIKDRLDIVEVISSYIATKKSGANYKASCPFHNEKSASLMISPQKQIWHCFGCGEGGDIFGFVMRHENLEFREALQQLAQKAGVTLPERSASFGGNNEQKKVSEELVRINSFAAKFYQAQLGTESAREAQKYLEQRRLNPQTIKNWDIGYAPDSFDALIKGLQAKNVTSQSALAAGVVAKNDRGNIFDRFRNRITFPIRNFIGEVVGFTARVLPSGDQNTGKYINSPETIIYNKSKILFGLFEAKNSIRKVDEVVVVEGQMDCIAAHQAGFPNTVATSGTAMTEDHVRLLSRLTKNITFCFDADSAGRQALRRAGELVLQAGFRVKVIVLPKDAKDPDELIRTSAGLWKKAINEAIWFIDYYIDTAEDQFAFGSLEQKQYLIAEVMPLFKYVTNPLEQGHYVRLISERFAVTENELRAALKPAPNSNANNPSKNTTALPQTPGVPEETIQEKEILGGILGYAEFKAFVAEEGLPSEYISPGMRGIINAALLGESQDNSLAKEAQFMVESSLENLENNELALMRELKKSFYLFKLAGIKKQLQDATTAIKKAESLNDNSAVKQTSLLFAELSNKRYTLEQKLES